MLAMCGLNTVICHRCFPVIILSRPSQCLQDVELNPFLALFYDYSLSKITGGVTEAKTGEQTNANLGLTGLFPRNASPSGTNRRPATRQSCGN